MSIEIILILFIHKEKMITIGVYINIADLTGQAQDRGSSIVDDMNTMKSDLNKTEDIGDTSDVLWLKSRIENTTTMLSNKNYSVTGDLIGFVGKLQKYITDNYTGGINSFLSDNNAKVSSTFASLSSRVGYTINSGNIKS
jgi:hypothetical protein